MKKPSNIILTIIIIFSSVSITNAKQGYIEGLLNLNYGVEEYDIELTNIDKIFFEDEHLNEMFRGYEYTNKILKDSIISKYRVGKLDYYRVNGVIQNHKKFIYYTNRFFIALKMKEYNPSYKDADDAILRNYRLSRTYYFRLKNLINNRNK